MLDPDGRQIVRTRTDQNGEYAATGFGDVVALVVASMPGRQAATAQLLLSSAQPVNHDFILGAQLPGIYDPDGSEPRERAELTGEPHQG